jgi:hypothetical protein
MKRTSIAGVPAYDLGQHYYMLECNKGISRRLAYLHNGNLELVEDRIHYTITSCLERKAELLEWFGNNNRPYFPLQMHDFLSDESAESELGRVEYQRLLSNARKQRYRLKKRSKGAALAPPKQLSNPRRRINYDRQTTASTSW